MAVVIDANLLVVLALDRAKAGAVEERLRAWRAAGESLHAPSLLRYEVASALTRAVDAGQLAESEQRAAPRFAEQVAQRRQAPTGRRVREFRCNHLAANDRPQR